MWGEMTFICGKLLSLLLNDLDMLETAYMCEKSLSCVGNGLNLFEMA